jgi:hypothetical protein
MPAGPYQPMRSDPPPPSPPLFMQHVPDPPPPPLRPRPAAGRPPQLMSVPYQAPLPLLHAAPPQSDPRFLSPPWTKDVTESSTLTLPFSRQVQPPQPPESFTKVARPLLSSGKPTPVGIRSEQCQLVSISMRDHPTPFLQNFGHDSHSSHSSSALGPYRCHR